MVISLARQSQAISPLPVSASPLNLSSGHFFQSRGSWPAGQPVGQWVGLGE